MVARYYSSSAVETTLSAPINSSATSIVVGSVSGFPIAYPYTLSIDSDNANKELVEVTAAVGTTLTVTRGVDSTANVSHTLGARVSHDHSARDFREPQEHIDDTAAHGATGAVVGTTNTQTLTNKTLTSPVIGGTPTGLTKTHVGLANVDNTSDANKPVSTAGATADGLRLLKASNLSDLASAATARTNLGLGNVDNTSDANKPVSSATTTQLNLKAPITTTVTLTGSQTLTNKTLTDPVIGRNSKTAKTPYQVANEAALPASGVSDGDLATTADGGLYVYKSGWTLIGNTYSTATQSYDVTFHSPFSAGDTPITLTRNGDIVVMTGTVVRASGSSGSFTNAFTINDSNFIPPTLEVPLIIGPPNASGITCKGQLQVTGVVQIAMSGANGGQMALNSVWVMSN